MWHSTMKGQFIRHLKINNEVLILFKRHQILFLITVHNLRGLKWLLNVLGLEGSQLHREGIGSINHRIMKQNHNIPSSNTGRELLLTLQTYLHPDHLSSPFPRAADQTSPGLPALRSLRVSSGFHRVQIRGKGQNLQRTRLDLEFWSQNKTVWLLLLEPNEKHAHFSFVALADVPLPLMLCLSPAASCCGWWQIVRHFEGGEAKIYM